MGSPGWCGVWVVAFCVVQFLDKVVSDSVVVLGLLVGTVQLLDKAADVPVVVPTVRLRGLLPGRVLQRSVEQIIDHDGVTVLKTEEVPQLQVHHRRAGDALN